MIGRKMAKQGGFTIVELLIAVVILGVIATALAALFPMMGALGQMEYRERQRAPTLPSPQRWKGGRPLRVHWEFARAVYRRWAY